jgi:hypothetical protein
MPRALRTRGERVVDPSGTTVAFVAPSTGDLVCVETPTSVVDAIAGMPSAPTSENPHPEMPSVEEQRVSLRAITWWLSRRERID